MITKSELLAKIYEEQLNELLRMQIDLDFFDYLIITEPQDQNNLNRSQDLKKGIAKKAKLVDIVKKYYEQAIKNNE